MPETYTCVVIDDSLIERESLLSNLNKIPNLNVKAIFEDGLKALTYLSENEVDIVISDIEMPYLKGIDLIKVLKTSPAFIFVTSHTGFAVEGFELNALDYIVKPVSFIRLEKAINKAIHHIQNSNQGSSKPNQSESSIILEDHYFYIRENSVVTKLNYAEVLYIESLSDFSKIYTKNDEVHMVLANLKSIETQLPAKLFRRVHKQFIINVDRIVSIAPNEVYLEGKKTIPMGNTYKQSLMESINGKILSRN